MKKTQKLKKCGLGIASAVVGLAVCSTYFAMGVPTLTSKTASADAATKIAIAENITVPEKCEYGKTFTVPAPASGATVEVYAPNGEKVTAGEGNKVVADQLGNYTVTYKSGDASYEFRVYVTLDEEYFLKVDNNGADIPTVFDQNGKFKLPDADVYYYDENNVLVEYPGTVELKITDSQGDGNTYDAGAEVTLSSPGKTYITYSASIDGGKKYFNETFTVNVQSTFSDSVAPTLAVSGVSKDISVNRAVTLPKATATDSFDENVKITIRVVDPDNNPVKAVDVDDNGYAYREEGKTYNDIVFDNDKAMTFYPTKVGTYVASYVAEDDKGNKSTTRTFTMYCSDLVAPVFESVDEHLIPEKWGKEVFKGNDAGEEVQIGDTDITFTVPTVVDNKDKVPEKAEDTDVISLYFRITDSDNSRTIVEFDNILALPGENAPASGATFKANKVYGDENASYYFDKDHPFKFNFEKYHRTDSTGAATDDLSGSYTVYYRASDKAGNRSSKTYTIDFQDKYSDVAKPAKASVVAPSYVSVTEETFTVPTPEYADASDSRPEVTYRMYSGSDYLDVKGGEVAEFVTESDGTYLDIDGDRLKLGEKLYFYLSVKDIVGNVLSNATSETDFTSYDEDAVTTVITKSAQTLAYADAIEFKVDGDETAEKIKENDKVNAGAFSITTDLAMRYYTGFEISVTDETGSPLDVTLETMSMPQGDKAIIGVRNITFMPVRKGKHVMTVRVFDVNGKSSVYAYTFNAEATESNGTDTSAATSIPTSGAINVKYKLHNEKITNIGESGKTYYVYRKITGSVFSVMGTEFIAKRQGGYSFLDGYVAESDLTEDFNFKDHFKYESNYSIDVTDTVTPVIEVQGTMPTYAPKHATDYITLPAIVAYSENGNAKIDVEISNKNGKLTSPAIENEGNVYKFRGTIDGTYTVKITATYAGATSTATYTVNVGDVQGPEFTITGGTTGRIRVGEAFEFGKMTLVDQSETGVTITKKLINPSKEEVTATTVSGSYTTYGDYINASGKDTKENKENNFKFDMSGTYEVVYTATDAVGNVTTQRQTISVVSSGSSTPTTFTTLSTVLIIVAVVLLAGVIIYVVRFRKVKK